MNWAGKQHPIETLVEWLAPAVLAGATGWSVVGAGFTQPVATGAGAAAFTAGFVALRIAGFLTAPTSPAFEPAPFEVDEIGTDELLLDDPLVEIAEGARVVHLFPRQEPTPGELVARIEDFLGAGPRGMGERSEFERTPRPIPDAGAALQAALANVRASLR